jgi:hypothetical protein
MVERITGTEPEKVFCEVCLKAVPKSAASMAEARDHVAYFCGLDCYRKWANLPSSEAPPELEIQVGHGRSKSKDERMKRLIRKTPQRVKR